MKKLFVFAATVLLAANGVAQNVGIGTTDPKATLDISGGSGEKVLEFV